MDKHRGAHDQMNGLLYSLTETDEQMDGQIHRKAEINKKMNREMDSHTDGQTQRSR